MNESLKRKGDITSSEFDALQNVKGGNIRAKYDAIMEAYVPEDYEGSASIDEMQEYEIRNSLKGNKRKIFEQIGRVATSSDPRANNEKIRQTVYHLEKAADIIGQTNWFSDIYERHLMFDFTIPDDDMVPEDDLSVQDIQAISLEDGEFGEIQNEFPSGAYLYHGSFTDNIIRIIRSGYIKNSKSLNSSKKGLNGGYEGISWSLNRIESIPGTRGHMAGFLAAPEDVLGDNKLIIPFRSARYEVQQVSRDFNAQQVADYLLLAADYNRYNLPTESPRALKFKNSMTKDERWKKAIEYEEKAWQERQKAGAISVPIEKLFFVCSQDDLVNWARVFKKYQHMPKGFLVYDNDRISRGAFGGAYYGNEDELSKSLDRVVSPNKKFWIEKMGVDMDNLPHNPRGFDEWFTLDDEMVPHDRALILDNNGEIMAINEPNIDE